MIGKLIVYGQTRDLCIMRLKRALKEYVVHGMKTTIPLHSASSRRGLRTRLITISSEWGRKPRLARSSRRGQIASFSPTRVAFSTMAYDPSREPPFQQ
jgi:hypothetical protein